MAMMKKTPAKKMQMGGMEKTTPMMKKGGSVDSYTNYAKTSGKADSYTDFSGKTSKPDSYTQYKMGGVVKAKTGVSLRSGQLKRIGRLEAKNPDRAMNVASRMVERDTRKERGQDFVTKNLDKLMPKRAKSGASLKPVDATKNPGLSKLPTPVRNKMGYQKNGGAMKAKNGAAMKKMQYGGDAASMVPSMKKGGKMAKCKYGCK